MNPSFLVLTLNVRRFNVVWCCVQEQIHTHAHTKRSVCLQWKVLIKLQRSRWSDLCPRYFLFAYTKLRVNMKQEVGKMREEWEEGGGSVRWILFYMLLLSIVAPIKCFNDKFIFRKYFASAILNFEIKPVVSSVDSTKVSYRVVCEFYEMSLFCI